MHTPKYFLSFYTYDCIVLHEVEQIHFILSAIFLNLSFIALFHLFYKKNPIKYTFLLHPSKSSILCFQEGLILKYSTLEAF